MSIEQQSDSKYYNGDCKCEKTEVSSIIAIQCTNCIDDIRKPLHGREIWGCTCQDVDIKHFICKTCAPIRDKIDRLKNELDELMDGIGYEIKQYMDCRDKIDQLKRISIELRHCNRRLLENLVNDVECHYSSDEC